MAKAVFDMGGKEITAEIPEGYEVMREGKVFAGCKFYRDWPKAGKAGFVDTGGIQEGTDVKIFACIIRPIKVQS